MRPFTRRAVGTVAALVGLGLPALSAGAAPGSGAHGSASASGGAPAGGTSCDHDRVVTSFGLDPTSPGVVDRIVVTGISPACIGHELAVVVAGVAGRAVASSSRNEVFLERGVAAADITAVAVAISLVERAGRTEAA